MFVGGVEDMDQLTTVTTILDRVEEGDVRVRELAEMLDLPEGVIHTRLRIMAVEGRVVYASGTPGNIGAGVALKPKRRG